MRGAINVMLLSASAFGVTGAAAQSFDFIGSSANGRGSVNALSADGLIAAGGTTGSQNRPAFWSRSMGLQEFSGSGVPDNMGFTAISDDGIVAAGIQLVAAGNRIFPHRFVNGSFQALGAWNNAQQTAVNGINGDGSVLVGEAFYTSSETYRAFRWTPTGGYQQLATPNNLAQTVIANDISTNSRVIVGRYDINFYSRPCIWVDGVPRTLIGPGNTGFDDGVARNVNNDGSIVVGNVKSLTGESDATVWRNYVPTTLPYPESYRYSGGTDISDDGSVVLGQVTSRVLPPGSRTTLAIAVWVNEEFFLLSDYLRSHGVEVPAGWTLYEPKEISADGRTFCGLAFSQDGVVQGFVASIPAPATPMLLLGAIVFSSRRRPQS